MALIGSHAPTAAPEDRSSSASPPQNPRLDGAPAAPDPATPAAGRVAGNDRRCNVSRRSFSAGLGATLLAAPFVELLAPRRVGAAPRRSAAISGKTAKRLVVFFCPNGTIPARWRPAVSGSTVTFPAGSVLEPLASRQKDLIVIGGLKFENSSNHAGGMAAMLTGTGGASDESAGMSVDQYVASKLGGATRLKSLELGVQTSIWGAGEQTRMSYAAAGQYAPPDDDPVSVYGRVFGSAAGGTTADPQQLRRQGVIDAVKADLTALRARLGAEEVRKLDQHIASIRELERSMGVASCSGGNKPAATNKDLNDNFPTIGKAQMDLLVSALACGATNVASIQWSFTVSPVVFSWLNVSDGHHTLSHCGDQDATGTGNFVKTERWFAEQFGYLLDQLEKTSDPGGGTLLDTTLVLWCKEMGDARLHVCTDVPMVLAGGGVFTPGRYIDAAGKDHTGLLLSICHAMGLTNNTFGNTAFAAGELAGL